MKIPGNFFPFIINIVNIDTFYFNLYYREPAKIMSYYHQQYAGNLAPEQVVIESKVQQRPDGFSRERPRWSWCSTGWSIFSLICCPTWVLCNVLGLVFSLTSYADHKTGDYERSNYKRKCSWGWTVTAIILGLLSILAVLLIIFVSPWAEHIQDAIRQGGQSQWWY